MSTFTATRKKVIPILAITILVLSCAIILCFFSSSDTPEENSALTPFLTDDATVTALDPLSSSEGEILRYRISLSRGHASAWVFPDGSVFWCEESTRDFKLTIRDLSSESAYHLNSADSRSPFLVESSTHSLLIQPPLARTTQNLNGSNYIAANENNGKISYDAGVVSVAFDGSTADWWAYLTPSSLSEGCDDGLSWMARCTMEKFGNENRMTLDGYYYKTPSNYIPTGDNHFYRIPAAYIASKLARFGNSHHGNQIAAAMLDIQCSFYNEHGFIPTCPASQWLQEDYKLNAGFYDTRFNTDVAHALLALGNKMNIEKFTDCAMSYADFLVNHSKEHSVSTENGILVEDYSHPDGNLPTHVSLNHQLSEILFLLETGNDTCAETAQKMLNGIEDTRANWIKDDDNLHYAYYPDETFGGVDYPYLTYNDLFALNNYLGGNETLESLMDAKRSWMTKNGVTGYSK